MRGFLSVDTRKVFKGHADIKHGIIQRKGNPLPPAQLLTLTERTKSLAALANYYVDPAPEAGAWSGAALRYKDQD